MQKAFDILGLGLANNISFKKIATKIRAETGKDYQSKHDLFAAIAEGEIRTTDIAKHVNGSVFKEFEGHPVRIHLRIVAKNRFGLLRDISDILYRGVLDLYRLKGWAAKYDADAFFSAEVLVPDFETLSHIFDELEQVEGITGVYRFSNRGVFMFSLAATLTAVVWIAHGYIIRLISISTFNVDYPFVANFLVYLGLVLLIVAVLFMRNLAQKYFPLMRKRKLLWIITFLIPVASTGVLFFETVYFNLHLSWITTLVEVFFIYAYLLTSYIHYSKSMKRI